MGRVARVAALLAAVMTTAAAGAQDGIRKEVVHFKPGASSATVQVTIKGDETVDYLLGAKAGQRMTVTLATKHTAAYFNVMPPGSTGEATFVGSLSGNRFEGTLEKDGEHTVRLYLMRSAARRGETAACMLTFAIAAK